MEANNSLSQESKDDSLCDEREYMRLIGRLLYLCITRSDLVYAVHNLSQFVSKPHSQHTKAVQRVLRYIK